MGRKGRGKGEVKKEGRKNKKEEYIGGQERKAEWMDGKDG